MSRNLFSDEYKRKITYICRIAKCSKDDAIKALQTHEYDERKALNSIRNKKRIKSAGKWGEIIDKTDELLEDMEQYCQAVIEETEDYFNQLMDIPGKEGG